MGPLSDTHGFLLRKMTGGVRLTPGLENDIHVIISLTVIIMRGAIPDASDSVSRGRT